jgi:C1A family cysteine protease
MPQKTIIVVVSLLFVAALFLGQQHKGHSSEFEVWKAKYGISFATDMENAYREKIFLSNAAKILLHNSDHARTYDMGINQFSAMTSEEFAQTYLISIPPRDHKSVEITEESYAVGNDIDWTSKGAVQIVKNQGQCGSCWAFSATGGIEGLSKLEYGQLQSFSEQMLVDCSDSYGNNACNGGLADNAYRFVIDNGIVSESDYPYVASKHSSCSKGRGTFKISGYKDMNTCQDLSNEVQSRPVSVAVDARNWSPYSSGVFSNCGTYLNHAVLLTGLKDGNWVVKNSWGPDWGEKGYIRLSQGNTCGICIQASYPVK